MIKSEPMTKQFTLLQLFTIVDGRIATSIHDIYDMLNHICGKEKIQTIEFTTALKHIKEHNPKWFQEVDSDINRIKNLVGDNFCDLMNHINIDFNNKTYEIPQLKDEFPDYDFYAGIENVDDLLNGVKLK